MFRYGSKDMNDTATDTDVTVYRAKVLSSVTRLEVWDCIGPLGMYAGDISRSLSLAASTVSHHLRVLEEAGLVQHVQQGRCRLYTWSGERWAVVSEAELDAAWNADTGS